MGKDLSSLFFWLNFFLARDIDSVKELSVILWTSLADLVGAGGTERNCSVVWSLKDELILDLVGWGESDLSSSKHRNELVLLSS